MKKPTKKKRASPTKNRTPKPPKVAQFFPDVGELTTHQDTCSPMAYPSTKNKFETSKDSVSNFPEVSYSITKIEEVINPQVTETKNAVTTESKTMTEATPTTTETTPKVIVLQEGEGFNVIQKTFEKGKNDGLNYPVIDWTDLDAAISTYGKDEVLAIVNQTVQQRQSIKIQNSLPDGVTQDVRDREIERLQSLNDGLVYPIDDIVKWRPGAREKTGLKAALEEVKELSADDIQNMTDPAQLQAYLLNLQKALAKQGTRKKS